MRDRLDDLDDAIRRVDRLAARADWPGLVELRDACRAAFERGQQLWPAASYCEYRLALDAPGEWAARVLVPGAGRFALGPLAEVAASSHTWAELAPHVDRSPDATLAAHERVVRGEDLRGAPGIDPYVLDLPLALQPWEPAYAVATYKAGEADFGSPPAAPRLNPLEAGGAGAPVDDPDAVRAMRDVVSTWTSESNGRADAAAVEGTATTALHELGVRRPRCAVVTCGWALAAMAWAAASGGAHGRRRGMAWGRFSTWWAVVALGGQLDAWPLPPDDVGALAERMDWYAWDTGEPDTGWTLRLAVEDPARGRAWALSASDAA